MLTSVFDHEHDRVCVESLILIAARCIVHGMKRRKRSHDHNITLFRVFCLARPGPA
jgi:hypothetical protein